MYKVFFNRKFVILTTKIVEHHDEAPLFYLKYINQDQIISALKSKKVEGDLFVSPQRGKTLETHDEALSFNRSSGRFSKTS